MSMEVAVADDSAKGSPLFKARRQGPTYQAEVMVPVRYGLTESAKALAVQLPDLPRRVGRKTLHKGLQDAARNNVIGHRLDKANPEMVALYRELLIKHEIFPAEALELEAKSDALTKLSAALSDTKTNAAKNNN